MIKASTIAGLFRGSWRARTPILLAIGAVFTLQSRAPGADLLSDEDLVRENYPSDLLEQAAEIARAGGPTRRGQAFVRGAFPGGAGADVVAVYDNGFGGAVRILRRAGQQVEIFDSPRFSAMGGSDCTVYLVDLDADGVPEIAAAFGSPAGGSRTWLFRWTSTGLAFIGPSTSDGSGGVTSALHDPTFRDFEGDGVLEVVESTPNEQGSQNVSIFKLVDGLFTLWKQPIFYAEYGRDGERSTLIDATVRGAMGTHTVWIMNGLPGMPDTRFRSAVLTWNGAILVPASDFGSDVDSLQVPVALSGEDDTLRVELRGSLDARMAVLIE